MKNRIIELFQTKKQNLLSVYYTAGFPNLKDTIAIAIALEKAGADIIEIGVPFSDPIADGPVIQESNNIALQNGMTVKLLLEQVAEIRRVVELPIILMGYLNPIMQFGMEAFCRAASKAGVDGLILPDMPMIEFENSYRTIFEVNNLCNTFLISPTTSEARIRKIDAATNGFIYAVSSSSTTGAKGIFADEQINYFAKLANLTLKNPFLIGFGISNPTTFSQACQYSSGAIVGSAFVSLMKNSKNIAEDTDQFVKKIKGLYSYN
jgi:tryptophan synthase alpha chain